MLRCPQCRKNFPEGTFCPDCHARLVKDEPERSASSAAPKVSPCPMCGSLINEPGWTVCRACGTPRPERLGSVEQAPKPSAECSEAEKTFSIALQSALADDVISPQEKAFLLDMGKRLGLSESYLDIVMGSLSSFMVSDEAVTPERPALEAVTDTTAVDQNAQSDPQDEAPVITNSPEDLSSFTETLMDDDFTAEGLRSVVKKLIHAGVSPQKLSRHIILTLGAEIKDNSDCYISPLFDIKKLVNASFVLPAVFNEDKGLLYFDNTVFGKGDEGFLLTEDTFYSSTKHMNVLPYASMTSVELVNKKIFINGVQIEASSSENNITLLWFILLLLSDAWSSVEEMLNIDRSSDEQRRLTEYYVLLKNTIDSQNDASFTYYIRSILDLYSDRDSLCREIILYIGKKIKDDSSVYLAPSFNMNKLCKAPFVYRAVQAGEELLLYFDSTFFGGGDEGFVLTNKSLYSSKQTLIQVPYHAIDSVSGNMKECSIQINGHELPMAYVSDERFKTLQHLFELISIIQKVTPLQS